MKHWGVITIAAVSILALGIVSSVTFLTASQTIAAKTIQSGKDSIVFRITRSNGRLYASAQQIKYGSHGWSSEQLIGEIEHIGISNAKIVNDSKSNHTSLHVGKATLEFDPVSRTFHGNQ